MSRAFPLKQSRRSFLTAVSRTAAGTGLLLLPSFSQEVPRKPSALPDHLSPEEKNAVEKSVMAKDLLTYFGEGYSCAESLLLVSLRFLGKPEDMIWAAAGFGGGMYHKDLCGILTGGLMGLGVATGSLKKERAEAKELTKGAVNAYWDWWMSQAPLHCAEIRTEGTTFELCLRLGQLAAARVETLIRELKT